MSLIGKNLVGPDPTRLAAEPEVSEALRAESDARTVATRYPRSSQAWARAAEQAFGRGEQLEAYAFARVGYHRGLDALRAAGWRGAGPVPWSHEPNRGFLRALYWLRRAAVEIGEADEVQRIGAFLDESDPDALVAIEVELAGVPRD